MAAAFQDVAIDGMTIDVVPEEQRAKANGFMWGGKTLGIAGSSLANGYVISHLSYGAAAMMTAAFVALIMLIPLLMRERPGEKILPWTKGHASPQSEISQLHKTWPMITRLLKAVLQPSSLLFASGVIVALFGYGLHTAYEPVFAIQGLGFSQADFGNVVAVANLVGGVFGIVLSGWIASLMGHRRALLAALVLTAALQISIAIIPGALGSREIFIGYTITHSLLFVLTSVCIYAEAMAMSAPAVAATQFSIYMAALNLGTSFGAQNFGGIRAEFGYGGVLTSAGLATLLACALFWGAQILKKSRSVATAS